MAIPTRDGFPNLIHSIIIQEKKDMLRLWNMVLIILTFTLCIFGTFLTRSGVMSSVHSFTESSLGPIFLFFVFFIMIASFGIMYTRLDDLKSPRKIESFTSRESGFLFNNMIFVVLCFAVFWGTLFPVISEAVRGTKITVVGSNFGKVSNDNINVYYVKPNGEPWGNSARYYNLNAAKKNFDQGFLKELVINYSPLEDPQNKIWSASKILHDYLHIPYGKRQEQFKERLENYTVNRNSNSLMQPIGVDDPKILPLQDTRFLKDWREIDATTIDHFKSQIFFFYHSCYQK